MRALCLALLLAMTGCAALPGMEPAEQSVDAITAEVLHAARAPAAEQKLALGRAQQAFVKAPVPANRLRLATLLATLPTPLRDDARAAELLEPLADAGSPGYGRFAALLAAQITDRQRLQREVDRAAREAERIAKDRERLDRERERSDKERDKREEGLKQQLEALRAIERGILDREERLRKKQR